MSQCIIYPSSKMCLCITLIPYGKPIIIVYNLDLTGWFQLEIVHALLTRARLIISENREKLLRLCHVYVVEVSLVTL